MNRGVQGPVVAVVGPTGTGKSDLGIAIARRVGGEIVNADALQFYRGMDIGTAKLSQEQRGGVPHHLLDILEIHDEASVAEFQQRARAVMAEIGQRGNVPVVVGGSGLYVRAVLDAIEFPGTDPEVRARIEAEGLEGDRRKKRPVHVVGRENDPDVTRANIFLDVADEDLQELVGEEMRIGTAVLRVTELPTH